MHIAHTNRGPGAKSNHLELVGPTFNLPPTPPSSCHAPTPAPSPGPATQIVPLPSKEPANIITLGVGACFAIANARFRPSG